MSKEPVCKEDGSRPIEMHVLRRGEVNVTHKKRGGERDCAYSPQKGALNAIVGRQCKKLVPVIDAKTSLTCHNMSNQHIPPPEGQVKSLSIITCYQCVFREIMGN